MIPEVALAHEIDSHERTRTGALRAVKSAADLLADAQHAVTHGRTEAALDLIERAHRLMTTQADRLRRN
jgi:hypothetical protein